MKLTDSISCIRWKEMRDGVEVFKLQKKDESEEKQVLGKSPKAGQMAVMQSAASRVFTNMCVLTLSPAFYLPFRFQRLGWSKKGNKGGEIPVLMIAPH
jgi:hypothetical protein